ncbi:c-type cytochrome [Billgrantia endophytica]|uniref:Cytochrome c domain-containing protein n=1 Tax=Billgrantia endophytica TaxID=2033802 RepID=A0A2N7U639_9GAMM|nr:c-type cytochrome [Halomonas endophytica]PMR75907.1 hypothetical protein C1H69_08155 [Halomonas endophytica]
MPNRTRPSRRLAGGLLFMALVTGSVQADDTTERTQGERLFRAQCVGCHSTDPGVHIAGPSLHELIGRPAGSLENFDYSAVLRDADLVWDAETLDAFLADPAAFLPGNRMVFWGLDERSRRRIILFLESLAP